jgi:hypothetical protein
MGMIARIPLNNRTAKQGLNHRLIFSSLLFSPPFATSGILLALPRGAAGETVFQPLSPILTGKNQLPVLPRSMGIYPFCNSLAI